jgi:hypothetical protein
MKRIFIVNGCPESGKDSFVNFCKGILPENSCESYSIIDPFKDILKLFGWAGEKTPELRKLLADMEDFSHENSKFGIINLFSRIKNNNKEVIFIFIRKPERIQEFIRYYYRNIDREGMADIFKVILVSRPEFSINVSNDADEESTILAFKYDLVILNNGSLNDLKNKAKTFTKENIFAKKSTKFFQLFDFDFPFFSLR